MLNSKLHVLTLLFVGILFLIYVVGTFILIYVTSSGNGRETLPAENPPYEISQLQTQYADNPFLHTPVPVAERTYIDDPVNYHIVYLVQPGAVPEGSFLAPSGLLQWTMHARIAHGWNDVQTLESQRPIDALIVHRSARDVVDRQWMAAAAKQGMVIVAINMGHADIAEMIDSECARRDAQEEVNSLEGKVDYFYLSAALSLAADPAEQPLVDAAVYDTCTRNPAIQSVVHSAGYAVSDRLDRDFDVGNLTDQLIGIINIMKNTRISFENHGRPPTAIPGFPPGLPDFGN